MPELNFRGLDEAARAAFTPHFADVVRRAGRRRRQHRTVAAGVAAAVVGSTAASGLLPGGHAQPGSAPGTPAVTPPFIPPGRPSPTGDARSGHQARTGAMVAGDVDHLYLRYGDCRGADCVIKVAATADGGRTWTSSPLPVTHNALVSLAAPGPLTVLAEVQQGGATVTQSWLASTDGGHTWHAVSVRQVDAIPTGWQILDGPPGVDQIAVLAADPATGALAELGQGRPLHLGRPVAGLPPAAGLWLTGYLGTAPSPAPSPYGDQQIRVGTGSTVAVSHDGGRTWHQQTFAEPLTANTGLGGATVASYDGRTAYAVGAANGELVVHRTDDGGLTWRRTPAQAHVGEALLAAAVRADGTLLVQVGYQAGDHPVMYESTDRGATLRAVPIGPGASAVPVDGGYAQSDWPNTSGAWLSPEGTAWSYVAPPALP